jgi:TetR/AcrR family transcriptional regulator
MTKIQDGLTARDRIIRAAILMFSRQGYYKTGTREIARLANVSEVTLFRYFEHKEDIFVAALNFSYQSVDARLKAFCRSVEGHTPDEVLPKIVRLLVDLTTFSPELLKLATVAVLELRGRYQETCYRLLAPLLTAITTYLSHNMVSGRLRNLNAAIVTAAMALTIAVQPELSHFIEGCELSRMNDRETLEEFSSFWKKVLIPA